MDIYHAKKQTENIPRLCSYLLLKTLFYFISQCTSVPYLESGLCKLDKELINCNFTFIKPRNRSFNKSNYEVCKYKALGYTGLFSLHIEPPSYLFYLNTSSRRYKLQILAAMLTTTSDVAYGVMFPLIYEKIYCQKKNFRNNQNITETKNGLTNIVNISNFKQK